MKLIIVILCSLLLIGCSEVVNNEIKSGDFKIDSNGNLIFRDENLGKIKGQDGTDGKNGLDGKDGLNGKNGIDGEDGTNGLNGINGVDGKDGETPYIGENGNWWIGSSDTGYLAIDKEDLVLSQGDSISVYPNEPFEWAVTLSDTVVSINRFEIFVDVIDFNNYSISNTRQGYLKSDYESDEVYSPYKGNVTISGTVETTIENPYYVLIWIGNEDYIFNLRANVMEGNEFLVEEEALPIYKVPNEIYFLKAEVYPYLP